MRKCCNCQKDTENSMYCSIECCSLYKSKKKKSYFCQCGKLISIGWTNRKKCEECFQTHKQSSYSSSVRNMTLGEARIKFKNIHQMHSRIRSLARSAKKIVPCEKCGYSKHVEVCHIKSVKDFRDDQTIEEVNRPENLICLCPNCHWEFDNEKDVKLPIAKKEKPIGNKNQSSLKPEWRKVERPNPKELIDLLANNSYEKIGLMFGVSGNAVRKWVKMYKKHRML